MFTGSGDLHHSVHEGAPRSGQWRTFIVCGDLQTRVKPPHADSCHQVEVGSVDRSRGLMETKVTREKFHRGRFESAAEIAPPPGMLVPLLHPVLVLDRVVHH